MKGVCAILLLACIGAAQAQEPLKLDYESTEEALKNLKAASDTLNRLPTGALQIERGDGTRAKPSRLSWRNTRLLLTYTEQGAAPTVIVYESLGKVGAVREQGFLSNRWGVPLPDGWTMWCETAAAEACAKALADYLFYYKIRVQRVREADALFAEALAKYRDPATRPPLPENVRKFKIQAEFAVDNKKLDDAINYYTQGVVAARWWADGYFNLALLLAERKSFAEAVRIMKRFIALQEGTPDARRALDMTYRWEAMIPADQRE